MSNVKSLLKSAKASLESNDPDSALDYCKEILKQDTSCYFAYVFQGKAYQLKKKIDEAIKAFKKATEIEPDNLLAWKGYFQIVKNLDDSKLFFNVFTNLVRLLIDQGISIAESLRDLRNYLDLHKINSNDELHEYYLKQILPGTELGELIGPSIEPPESTVRKLLDFKQAQLEKAVVGVISKERVKFGRAITLDQKSKLDEIAYGYYSDGLILNLYDLFLNICNDDALRRKYEDKLLKFKYDLLKICPDKDAMYKDIKSQVDDMILLDTPSLFCWNLYFDWSDAKTIIDLDEDKVISYLQKFQNEGLGLILFAYVMSELSPFNKDKIVKGLSGTINNKEKKQVNIESEEDAKALSELADDKEEEEEKLYLPLEEVLELILQGYSKAKSSVLANRIIVDYYIHIREYSVASERCRDGIRIVADIQRTFGIILENTKENFLCSLAIVYTYYEAPKNYNRAIQLYDKVLENDPSNVKAKVGKGLIFVERGELEEAKLLLEEVVENHPDNLEAKSEYYWCLIKLGEPEKGRIGLQNFLKTVTDGDLHSRDVRAIAYWRISQSYLIEEKIDECHKSLVQSLKESDLYAPSYTSLGIIFQDYYGDLERAQKCFYKAFELDLNEIEAAKYLVEQAAFKNEWEVVQVLAKRVVTNESSRRLIMRSRKDSTWPYRVLGSAALNVQDDAKAVEWYQNALRLNSEDFECWVGLGEAYYNCGRFDAASKVFQHAIEMKKEVSWVVKYMLGVVTCEMKEFNEGLTYLYEALEMKPSEECILSAIYEANIENTKKFMETGYFGRAINANLKALRFIKQSILENTASQKVWKALGDCLKVFIKLRKHANEVPIDDLIEIFTNLENDLVLDKTVTLENAKSLFKQDIIQSLHIFVILSSIAAINYLPQKTHKLLRATCYYNLGLSLLESYQNDENVNYRDASITYLKKAIQIESSNPNYWIALGNAYFSNNPQISQHCYIKATTLEAKDAEIWVNLASLFLRYGDTELSQETFLRAQSVAPQDAQSWLGHAVTSEILGDESKANSYYTHAFTLSKGRLALAHFLYGLSIINKSEGQNPKDIETAQEFGISNYAMQQYLKYYPDDENGLSIALSIAERCKDYETALMIGDKLCSIYEKKFEKTESILVMEKFAIIKGQLSRINLGLGQFDKSIEEAEMATQLIEEGEGNENLQLSIRITLGLCYFFKNEFEKALEEFKIVLNSYSESSRIVNLIAQVLYAHGTEETKQAAIDQLFTYIEENGSSLLVVLTLGAISIVDNLEEYLPAIKEELLGLNLNEIMNDVQKEVPKLLSEINERFGDDNNDIWNRYAYLFPFNYHIWKNINHTMANEIIKLHDVKVTGIDYSMALLNEGTLRNIQRSLLMNPNNESAIQALEMCI
ncbi:unnamed protein product [Candida verbasci]|uniref:Superkiller protein 3 n=1 Tax=Candida verbasci TaxID=1227364 RepID=A0A9W4X9K7_9ASCO|nr:unnamed protein product [Candida verbasci]